MNAPTFVIGRPAAHVSSVARKALAAVAAWSAMSLAGLGVAVVLLQQAKPAIAAIVACAGLAAGWWATQRNTDYAKAAVGARSERRVGGVLERVGANVVAHGVLLGAGGDADHIVAGPCLAVVETKTGAGRVTITSGGMVVGRKRIPKDPVGQARRQATALRKLTGTWTQAVVCVVDAEGPPFQVGDVWVTSLSQLPAVLGALPRVLDDRAAARVAELLT